MQPDDLYPSDPTYFMLTEPQEQVKSRRKEKAETLQALSVLEDLVKHLDERIKFYESVDSMPNEVKDDPVKFMNMHNANQLTRDNLKEEKELIQGLIVDHAR